VAVSAGSSGADEAAKKDYSFDLSRYAEGMGMHLPVTDGLITDWDWLERVWEHAMADTLRADNKDTPVLMTEKVFNPSSNRQRYFPWWQGNDIWSVLC
jgi:actin-related protein